MDSKDKSHKFTIIITGASSGFGALSARALADHGHTVYAGVRAHEADSMAEIEEYAKEKHVELRWVHLDVTGDKSCREAVERVISERGSIDVLIHNAGHMTYGFSEAFTPEQFRQTLDVNVVGTQRLNRHVLPHMRSRNENAAREDSPPTGLMIWVSSASHRGFAPPLFGPYFAAKAAMDSLAVTYAAELSLWGIETSIIIPGPMTTGTNHFADRMQPADQPTVDAYVGEAGPYRGVPEQIFKASGEVANPNVKASDVADAVVEVVNAPYGKRPFRTHVATDYGGCHIVAEVADRMRTEGMKGYKLTHLLSPQKVA